MNGKGKNTQNAQNTQNTQNTKNTNVIIIADIHFGIKRFNIDVLRNQISLFNNQIFPYMEKNNITEIYQLGDLLDNRTTTDIGWLETLKREFFDTLKKKNFKMFTLLGNHDIFHRESRDISLIETLSQLYPDNFRIYKEREIVNILGQKVYMVPWITKNETLKKEELQNIDFVFGHFEVRGFSTAPGHIDEKSELTEDYFRKQTDLKGVFSGHYHLRNTKGFFKYLGSAFQLNWGDHNDLKGFYDFNGSELVFIENTTTKKFIKVKYNDENEQGEVEVKGFKEEPLFFSKEEYEAFLPNLNGHEVKTFINKSKDDSHQEVIELMKNSDIPTTVINNQEVSELIGIDNYTSKYTDTEIENTDTRSLIIDTVTNNKPELLPLLTEIMNEIDSEINKEL